MEAGFRDRAAGRTRAADRAGRPRSCSSRRRGRTRSRRPRSSPASWPKPASPSTPWSSTACTRASASRRRRAGRRRHRSRRAPRQPRRLPPGGGRRGGATSASWPAALAPAPVSRVPFLPTDVHDLDGLDDGRRPPARPPTGLSGSIRRVRSGRPRGRLVLALALDRRRRALGRRARRVRPWLRRPSGDRSRCGRSPVVCSSRVRVGRGQATATSPPELADPADPTDEGAEAGRVDERHPGEVDQQPRRRRQLGQRLAELAHREGVELADRAAHRALRRRDRPGCRALLAPAPLPGGALRGWYR